VKKLLQLALVVALSTTVLAQNRVRLRKVEAGAEGNPTIAWSTLTQAGASRSNNAQLGLLFDPQSQDVWYYGTDNSGIYSTASFFGAISGSTITFTKLGGTAGTSAPCYSDGTGPVSQVGGWNNGDGSALQPHPADRHPETMSAVDTSRNHLYQWSGLACGNPSSGDGIAYRDLWRLALNASPGDDTWTQVSVTTKSDIHFSGGLVYASGHDVLVLTGRPGGGASGNPETWVLCPDPEGNGLSASQSAAGCTTAHTWDKTWDPGTEDPSYAYYANYGYSSTLDRVLMFKMYDAGGAWTMQVWAYHLLNKTWTQRTATNAPANLISGWTQQLVAQATTGTWANKFFYHRTNMNGSGSGQAADYMYDPDADEFVLLDSTGTGPASLTHLTYAPHIGSHGALVAYEAGNVWWVGVLQ
jgi:hypothetical protein